MKRKNYNNQEYDIENDFVTNDNNNNNDNNNSNNNSNNNNNHDDNNDKRDEVGNISDCHSNDDSVKLIVRVGKMCKKMRKKKDGNITF